jgi:hypothetical protein
VDNGNPNRDSPTPRLNRALRHVVQGEKARRLVLLVLFALLVVTAGRGTRADAELPVVSSQASPALASVPAPEPRLSAAQSRTAEIQALDNLLSRYDALIRALEARGVDTVQDSSASLTELRTLRATLYDVSRRAIQSTDPPQEPHR